MFHVIPTIEDIEKEYYEIVPMLQALKTKQQIINFSNKHKIDMEINGDQAEEFNADENVIEYIRCYHWGEYLSFIYVYNNNSSVPTFDVYSDYVDDSLLEDMTIDGLRTCYYDQMYSLFYINNNLEDKFDLIKHLRDNGTDYKTMVIDYKFDAAIVEQYKQYETENKLKEKQNKPHLHQSWFTADNMVLFDIQSDTKYFYDTNTECIYRVDELDDIMGITEYAPNLSNGNYVKYLEQYKAFERKQNAGWKLCEGEGWKYISENGNEYWTAVLSTYGYKSSYDIVGIFSTTIETGVRQIDKMLDYCFGSSITNDDIKAAKIYLENSVKKYEEQLQEVK